MIDHLAAGSMPRASGHDSVGEVARAAAFECGRVWASGSIPSVGTIWTAFSPKGSVEVLSAIVKVDIQARFARGERPGVGAYLDRFAALRAARERVVSLVYEEYCLREEVGEHPNPESFCARYDPWRDSLLSQLRYHQVLSKAVGTVHRTRPLPSVGERFLSFRLQSVLGRGGTATVFLANDESLGDREVALKLSADRGREPAIQGRLDHAHIVPVHSVNDDPETGLRGLVMPYRAGLPLDEIIRRVDPASRPSSASVLRETLADIWPADDVSAAEAAERWRGFPSKGTYAQGSAWIVSVVARALAYAHARGVLHRDVKPANVLLTARDGPQLLDFNLSHSPNTADQAEAALRGGTLPYMAPEQLAAFLDPEGWGGVAAPADIYSLGLLLRELLTGRRPESPDPTAPLPRAIGDLLDRRATGVPSARTDNPDVPYALEAILAQCLAFRPEDRYSSAKALAEDLERFVSRRPLVEAVNPSKRERILDFASRWRLGRVAALSVGILAVSLLVANLPRKEERNAGVHVKVAQDHLQKKEWDLAYEEASKAIKINPTLFSGHWARANAQAGREKLASSLSDIEIAVQLAERPGAIVADKHMAALFLDKAKIAHRLGLLPVAEAAYGRALHFDPGCYPAIAASAIFSHSRGNYETAVDLMNKATRLLTDAKPRPPDFEPTLATFRGRRALALVLQGGTLQAGGEPKDFREAARFYKEAWNDISAARTIDGGLSPTEAANLDFAEACTRMALGDLSSALDTPEEYRNALNEYQPALACLLAAKGKGDDALVRKYEEDLRKRIDDTLSKLAR